MNFRIIVRVHRAELQALETGTELSKTFLPEDHWTLGRQLDGDSNNRKHRAEKHEQERASRNIDRAFDHLRSAPLVVTLGQIRIEPGIRNRLPRIPAPIFRKEMRGDDQAGTTLTAHLFL